MFFITVEGQDGSGKSTQIQTIVSVIEDIAKAKVVVTREVGGTPLAEDIRQLLLHKPMSARTEALLANAARCDHVENVIEPALEAGHWVVSDRYVHSTMAYQCGGGGLYKSVATDLHEIATRGRMPDLVLLFDVEPSVGKSRMSDRTLDKFEAQRIEFVERVRARYLSLARSNSRIVIIDANKTLDEVTDAVKQVVSKFVIDATGARHVNS